MNLSTMTTDQLALILHGLRSIYVDDKEAVRTDMIAKIEAKLSERGMRLAA